MLMSLSVILYTVRDQVIYTEIVANSAIFAMQGNLYSLNQTTTPMSMKLFDSLVTPNSEYDSEMVLFVDIYWVTV